MEFYHVISADDVYDFDILLKRAYEQQPQGFKEFFMNNYFNALYVFKTDDENGIKVNFVFGTNYNAQSFKINLEQSTDLNQIFNQEQSKYIKQLNEYKYSRSITRKDAHVNIGDGTNTNLFEFSLKDLPLGILVSIKFRRSNDTKSVRSKLSDTEKIHRNINRKISEKKEYQDSVATRLSQINYMFDVEFEVATVQKEEIDKAKVLSFYNNCLKVNLNNRYNNIKISRNRKYYLNMFSVRDQYTLEELKRLIYIPTPSQFKENDLNKLPIHYFNSKYYLPKENEFKEGITVGWIFHPILEKRAIKIPYSILSQHLFTGGMSGSGKSASLHEMVDDLIPEVGKIKPGYLFFDPKRLSAVRIINHILAMWKKGLNVDWSRIHYIDLKLGNYVPSFNLLYKSSYRNSTEIINKTLELFKDVYDSGDNTALLDKMIRNLVGALVLGKQDATILDAVRMVEDTRFRSKVASGIKGSINKEFVDFWKKEYKDSDFNSTINRLSMFQPATMKRMYGQKGFDLDFEKWQREGHIVIINGLDMTDRATTLTVGQIVNNHLEQLLNSKSNKGFMVIIDEGARAQVNGYFRTLAEGREVGAWLSFCTQDISLMKTKFATGLLKNISSYKVGRHDPESAKKMSQSLGGAVDPITIQNLPNNTMLLKTMNKDNDNNLVTMQVTSNPPYWYLENGDIAEYGNEEETEQAIKWSEEKALELQKRDWKHRDEIDKELFEENKNIFNDEIFDIIESDVNNQSIAKVF